MSLLELKGVEVQFSGFRALRGFDLSVAAGELRCLIGPNGAGKTTALDVICGKAQVNGGDIIFAGQNISHFEEHRIARLGIGRKFQVPSVFRELTVKENLHVAFCRRAGVFANLGISAAKANADELEKLAELVGLKESFRREAGILSHGQTQWLEIAMLVAQDAQLLLLDEPTAGMGDEETHHMTDLIRRLNKDQGITMLFVEHDMAIVFGIADRITVLDNGTFLAEGTAAEISANPRVQSAYLGTAIEETAA